MLITGVAFDDDDFVGEALVAKKPGDGTSNDAAADDDNPLRHHRPPLMLLPNRHLMPRYPVQVTAPGLDKGILDKVYTFPREEV